MESLHLAENKFLNVWKGAQKCFKTNSKWANENCFSIIKKKKKTINNIILY